MKCFSPYKKYVISALLFLLLPFLIACTQKNPTISSKVKIDFNDKNAEYYYCAILEAGIDFNIMHKIGSKDDFNRNLEFLKKLKPKSDANYYKLVKKENKITLHGYSMRTNELREIIMVNSKNRRLIYTKKFKSNFKETEECYWKYNVKDKVLISTETCGDIKNIRYFDYIPKWESYGIREHLIYKNNEFIEKRLHDASYSTVKSYDKNGTLIEEGRTMGESDFCIPFDSYEK